MKVILASQLEEALRKMLPNAHGKLAYILARDVRLLSTELTEFHDAQKKAFVKFGKLVNEQYVIDKDSEGYLLYLNEMKQYEDIDIEVDLMKIPEEVLMSSDLSGEEMIILQEYLMEG